MNERVARTAELKEQVEALAKSFYAYHATVVAADQVYWSLREQEDACAWWQFRRKRVLRHERLTAERTVVLARRDMDATKVEIEVLTAEMYAL